MVRVVAPVGRSRKTVFVNVESDRTGLLAHAPVRVGQILLPCRHARADVITRREVAIGLAGRPEHLPLLAVGLAEIGLRIDQDALDVQSHRDAARLDFLDGATEVLHATQIVPRLVVAAAAVHRVPAPVEDVQVVHAAERCGIRGHDFLAA